MSINERCLLITVGYRSLQAFKYALHLHQGFHRGPHAFGHQRWADGFAKRSSSFFWEELHGMGLHEMCQRLLVKESQQALGWQKRKQISHDRMTGT